MHFVHILTALAVLFLGALAGGRFAALCRLPRVTGYLMAGLAAGPSFAHLSGFPMLITADALLELRILSDIGLALIMMNIGGQFRTENLVRWRSRIALFSFGETSLSFLLAFLFTAILNFTFVRTSVAGMTLLDTSLSFGVFFGIIAMATSPAATLMVIREYESEGPVTSAVLTLVGLNNLLAITLFSLATHFLVRPGEGVSMLIFRILFPVILGSAIGFALSVWAQKLELPSEHKILLLGGVAAITALCRVYGISPLLANLTFGVVLANSSPNWHRLLESVRQVDYPLYVAFFVLAGANLHIETLAHIGLLGIAYVIARTVGKYLGAAWGARLGAFGEREREVVGYALLAQAGVAIGLSGMLASEWEGGGKLVETVILGAVVIFEVFGPLAVRHGLVRAGEVPLLSLLQKRAPQGTLEGLHSVVYHFRQSLGLPLGHKVRDPGDILVKHVMRQNVETILDRTPFNELLRLIAHSRYDRFPVVDENGRFVGMINYTEVRNFLFEPTIAPLLVAADLATAAPHALFPDQPLREALKTLELNRNISYFPVIDPDQPERLQGILSQNDVLAAFRRLEKG